jgi:hypothetical protein
MQATGTLQRPMQRPWRRRAVRARVAAAAAVRGRTTLTRPVEVSMIHSDIHRANDDEAKKDTPPSTAIVGLNRDGPKSCPSRWPRSCTSTA